MAAQPPEVGPAHDWDALTEVAGRPVTVEARGYGTCQSCMRKWKPGDLIGYLEDEEAWGCGDCARQQ